MLRLPSFFLTAAIALSACGDDAPGNPDAAPPDIDAAGDPAVTINFAAKVGTAVAACGQTYDNLGVDSDQTIEIRDLRFYVSNVRLTNGATETPITLDQDSPFQTAGVALLDFEDNAGACQMGTAETNSTVTGTVPEGEYTGLAFDVAVPFDLNHQDLVDLPSPLNISTMYWAWAIGHKFIRIDLGVGPTDGARAAWNVHLGSHSCGVMGETPPTEECGLPNKPSIVLADFDAAADTVVLDIEPLVADSDLTANVGMAPGCQSFPTDGSDCTPLFPNLGIDYADGLCINDCADQSVFLKE